MARGARSNKGKALRRLRREKVENSEVYKAAEQKRFGLIQKSLEEAAVSKAEEAAQRALTEPAAMEADEGRAASGRAAEAAGGLEKMDIEDSDKRSKSKLGVKKKGVKIRKGNSAIHGLFHVKQKKGKKPKRQWFVE
ncbi:hypothetical protein COCSUDRAFT_61189 [Coccomyxa subellipsoidea C-169]|uniref:Uncharacterized protein n=1 Tax=Coccomyxa subellipsoidea (strain C-169) TaxID=574566 RepID=I0Z6D6_COCSC|nr:hypothetical protein COCSUDRAFT_61189 [Coccomyxa subellipsoidea C-169]EIE26205.1 hypothetical protein COCSUDRAFT_61189 [Coccomyxa subellipsoidea C-169]|eukprot:XP_005650749.1 hypothetical protein COCSUDRAFT_61189 [Coccomyxa subellipsoidea C-169]